MLKGSCCRPNRCSPARAWAAGTRTGHFQQALGPAQEIQAKLCPGQWGLWEGRAPYKNSISDPNSPLGSCRAINRLSRGKFGKLCHPGRCRWTSDSAGPSLIGWGIQVLLPTVRRSEFSSQWASGGQLSSGCRSASKRIATLRTSMQFRSLAIESCGSQQSELTARLLLPSKSRTQLGVTDLTNRAWHAQCKAGAVDRIDAITPGHNLQSPASTAFGQWPASTLRG